MSEISSFMALPREPRLLIAVIRAFGVRDRQHEAGRPVEKAELEQIDADECPDAMRRTAQHRYLPVRDGELFSAERRILINAADRVFQTRDWIMQQRLLQPCHGAVAHDALVHNVVGEAAFVTPE